ncbi:hypothetical protein [Brevundimonas sp. Root1279]|uniref:hypothetical protein n=1 Tax=Brevundimonas sp. Root1279 TaxID=1736443 RepID=UPI000700A149|nr:hypothetical protein [Brevundimonas sp. Root1279]KQW86559.1 hypothetical protein ASC65_01300 [Brevundimonas sp. Root1279]
MKLLRLILVLALVAYAGWLAWPLISPLMDGGPESFAARAVEAPAASEQLFGFVPSWALWAAAVGLYLIAALLLGAGNPKAAVAYFLGFLADAALRLALDSSGDAEAARAGPASFAAPDVASSLPIDPVWLVLGGLFLLGVLVMIAARRARRVRNPGQLAY